MATLARSTARILVLTGPLLVLPSRASAQASAPSATASFPPVPTAPAATPAPAPAIVPTPAPAATPATATPPPAAPPPPAPPPSYPQAQPIAEPAPPPPPAPGSTRPEFSARVDPFNLLLEGRLGLEFELSLSKYVSVELVPVFVVMKSPPMLNYNTYEKSSLHQESNGWGPLSGAALDAGLWFGGKPFRGYVLRLGLTNYAYTYKTTAPANDSVSHTDRQLFAMFGSHSRWGLVTLAYGFGLAYELNQENRCFDALGDATSNCPKDQLLIKLNQTGTSVADLHSYLYPFDFLVRFSLGVVF